MAPTPSVLDPLIAEREAAACRSITVERAMELIVENARLGRENAELRNQLALYAPAFAARLEVARGR